MASGNVEVIYGNVGFTSDNIKILNGSKDGKGDYNFKPIYGTKGLFFVQFAQQFAYPPSVILTQIYHGSQVDKAQDPKGDTNPQWGSTRDNAVLVGVSAKEFKLITGDTHGGKQNRMFGFIAVGFQDPAAPIGYVDPRSRAAGLKNRI